MFLIGERSEHLRSTLPRFPEWGLCDFDRASRRVQNHKIWKQGQPLMTKKIAVATLALCISLPATAQTNNDPIKWAWTCKSSGFYTIEAFPDGSYKPAVDFTGNRQVVINIRQASKAMAQWCGSPDTPKYLYFAEMLGIDLAKFYSLKAPLCSEATPSLENSTLNEITGSARGMSFIVSRDDNDWRFIISGTDLTTERRGRELRIRAPSLSQVKHEAKAGVWMITGQCIMTTDQSR
jgi:hypothetical protein